MRYIAWMAGEVGIPVIHKLVQDALVIIRAIWIVGCVPGVLENDRESHPDIALINRLHVVHDAQNVIVRRDCASQRRCIFKVGFSCQLDNFHRREYRRSRSGRSVANKLAGSCFYFILKSYTA